MDSTSENRRLPASEADIDACTIGGARPLQSTVYLAEYDSRWPELFQRESQRIRQILGPAAIRVEHVGSTSVPRLAAKPIIDMLLEVADSSDESSYVTPLEAEGYELRIREPHWWEHRVLKGPDTDLNLHVFSTGCPEIERMLKFRDHLRDNNSDRALYEQTKRDLAARRWEYIQNYADAKTEVIDQIITRARGEAT